MEFFFVRDKVYIVLGLYIYIRRLNVRYIYIFYEFCNINHIMYIKFKKQ